MANGDLTNLAKYGLSGVCIALIALVCFVLNLHFKADNENREIGRDTVTVLQEMRGSLDNNNKAIDDLNETIEDWMNMNNYLKSIKINTTSYLENVENGFYPIEYDVDYDGKKNPDFASSSKE